MIKLADFHILFNKNILWARINKIIVLKMHLLDLKLFD